MSQNVIYIDNISSLRSLTSVATDATYIVKGYYTVNDGGGGTFVWDSNSTATEDNGSIIKVTSIPTGRFYRLNIDRVNVKYFGAKPGGGNADATTNYNAIKDAIAYINKSDSESSVLYFPRGTYYSNSLSSDDGIDFRYVNIVGDCKRKSILKLADGESSPLIYTDLYFETYIRDIQFNGNKTQATAEYTVHFKNPNCYTVHMIDVYFRDANEVGLYLEHITHFTLDKVDAKYGGIGGIKVFSCLSVSINHTDVEQNTDYGILVKSIRSAKDRYATPLIYINNPYCEQNGTGIILESICRVNIQGGYLYEGIFLKITDDGNGGYSLFNKVKGVSVGYIKITSGNYGNTFDEWIPIIDEDGRNGGREFLEWDYLSQNFNGSALNTAYPTNLGSKTYTIAAGNTVSYPRESILNDILAYSTVTSLPACGRLDANSASAASSFFIYPNVLWSATETCYIYLLFRGNTNQNMYLRLYNMAGGGYYNWNTKMYQSSPNANDPSTTMPIPITAKTQAVKIPVEADGTARKWRVQVILPSKNEDPSLIDLYYAMVSESDNLGMLHYDSTGLIGRGNQPYLPTTSLPPAANVTVGTTAFDTTLSKFVFSNGTNWIAM